MKIYPLSFVNAKCIKVKNKNCYLILTFWLQKYLQYYRFQSENQLINPVSLLFNGIVLIKLSKMDGEHFMSDTGEFYVTNEVQADFDKFG